MGTWGYLEAAEAVIEKWATYLVGQDPLRIEHHWQYLYRSMHFRGAAIMGALSAIDIALWDIAGKHFGVPVYELLGGKTRNKARVYYHVLGETVADLVAGCKSAMDARLHRRWAPVAVRRRAARASRTSRRTCRKSATRSTPCASSAKPSATRSICASRSTAD